MIDVAHLLRGGKSVREDDWKLVDLGDGQWRLFDLSADPGETRDLAQSEPRRVSATRRAWDEYAQEVGVILPNPRSTLVNRPTAR